ncbi:DUF2852 domain-containing protein [Paracoccus sediminicola]|uniref:DUF2852 domain-containing protein n=1 Tax=Paracoccus sediminicola TaxID=3017783 RepID=UPI0022F08280|nr:DUF2852 domain-containing protein [Paracoccus sediminicola]WBU55658.1 DUF2852 domain-containing protein [Paracoccus sediminicola]
MARLRDGMIQTRDWLDGHGKKAWLMAMIAGFIFVWPVGLALLFYMIGSNRMFSCQKSSSRRYRRPASSGNSAFDAYREETLKRMEQEHEEFMAFMARLREARDKAEFDQFMKERRDTDERPVTL